jgi:4-carboxymuconolactone decarboxylase
MEAVKMRSETKNSAAVIAVILIVGCGLGLFAQNAQAPPNPREVQLVGDRFKPLKYDDMTPAQKMMMDHLVQGERRGAGGPFNVLLRSPEMGDLVQQFGASMRFHSSLPRRLNEMAIIITARHWTAQYEWNAHRAAAAQAGLKEPIIQAIAAGKRPGGMDADETIIYNFATELLNTHQVSDANYQAVKDKFGEKGTVDLIGVMGYYQLVSMLLNVDRYPLPAGAKPELQAIK